jgi:hypothetical protein
VHGILLRRPLTVVRSVSAPTMRSTSSGALFFERSRNSTWRTSPPRWSFSMIR